MEFFVVRRMKEASELEAIFSVLEGPRERERERLEHALLKFSWDHDDALKKISFFSSADVSREIYVLPRGLFRSKNEFL